MTRRLYNWTYREVTDFLREKRFRFHKAASGSHQLWTRQGREGEQPTIVDVNFTRRAYPPKTLKLMIKQSGIEQKEWIEWAGR